MGSTEMIKSKKLALAIALGLIITVTPASAATKSPTPTPKATVTKKVTPTPKATVTKKAPVKKAPVKKAPVKKKKKKVVKLTPSPSPKWPPTGFKTDPLGETKLYMKIPTAKELVGILSAKTALSSQIKACTKFTCGAVSVASEIGCRWWQVTGDLVGATSAENRTLKTFGKVTTSVTASDPQKVVTILLITTEPIGSGHIISNISADCNQGDPTGPIPNTEYRAVG
jgi:outer membrane biosynthesis protein TonB